MDFRKLWSLFLLSLRHPLFVIPTLQATRKCVAICDTHFGKAHHRNGPANAFRHALWNMMIVQKSVFSGRDFKEAMVWAKTITNWHEDFSPNRPLARAMDIHNNKAGRDLITIHQDKTVEEFTLLLLEMLPLSRKHTELQELINDTGYLVHIED
tara:strand:+ start:37353 stop:37814 length:462 start_codon:yes stop_codon:yes gene_type:complete